MENRFVESARSSEPHCVLTCCLCEAKRWATAVTRAAPLLLPLSERQNLTSHSGISRPKTFRRRLEYLKWGQCRVQIPLAICSSRKKKVFNPVQRPYDSHDVLLRMRLVHGPVHAHRDFQLHQLTVGFDSSQDRRQTGSHQVRRPEGHYGADVLNSHAVFVRRAQTQPS